MTTVKILNNGKIHKLSQLPQTFSSLQDSIKLILQDTLPNSYILQYEDLEGDHVMLASEEDYAAMLLTELPKDLSKSLRIHVVSRDRPETGYNKDPTYCGMQEFVQSDNKDIHEQIQEGNNTQNLNAKPHLKAANNDEMLDSSDEEEKDDRSRSDFDHHGKDKKHKYGDFDKDEMKKQKKVMKKEIKAHRMAKKTELLKDAITEALFDNLPTIAKVVKAYVDDPTMNLEETVQNARPKTTLGSQLEDAESLQGHFKRPFLMFRSLIDVYRGLTDEQKTETNKLLGGIPEKLLTGDHEKTKEGGPWGGPGGPWGGHGGHWGPPGHPWGGPGGPWGGPGGPWGGPWGHRHRRGGDWNSEQSEEQQQEGKWRHKHHHHHHGGPPRMDEKNEKNEKYEKYNKYDKHDKHDKYDKYDKYEKKDKKDKFEGQEGWKKKDREGGNEEKKRDKKDWRTKEEENVGSEFSMELVKEVGTVPPKVSVSDGTIYKTVIIKNTGAVEWPRSALLVPRGEIRGENVRLTNVKPGQEYTPVLVMKGTGKVGTFVTKWKLAYKDEQGKNYFTGASIDVGVDVLADS